MRQFKYEQLADQLKNLIDAGQWQTHEKVPSIRTLAQTYHVSVITVQKALHTLEARNILWVKNKSGYYVNAPQQDPLSTVKNRISQPKLVNVPDVFYEIMERGAAFDISPQKVESSKNANSLLLLNRHISRALRHEAQHNALYYSEPSGDKLLRQQMSKHYRKRNVISDTNDICVTSGCQNSLFLALMATCKPGDIVAIESPAFYGLLQLLQHLQLKVVELPSSFTTGLSVASFNKAIETWHVNVCILTVNFATPTGALMPSRDKQEIVALAHKHNITLIEDDIYGDLGFHSTVEPLKTYDTHDNVILCSSFSKSLSRDLRIGWIISKRHYKKIAHLKLIYQLSTSQATQKGLTSFMAEGHFERHLHQFRKTLLIQQKQLIDAIQTYWHFAVRYTVPDGGLSIWIELPECINTLLLYNRAITDNIVITPGGLFTAEDKFSNFIRLSFAHPTTGKRLKALIKLGVLCENIITKRVS
ncbi:PLP-dependent aminotransferase family protein [Algibacillus agarilyticus]|uniref:aminotransferase-like domain-containing protein n=1 Tax=Algibacillus agarilyticus TaxID=2234133 RepID=UPI000DD0C486|nr:PLP-dependent aminotransferase family protein [Algibacillus agarilyticus]